MSSARTSFGHLSVRSRVVLLTTMPLFGLVLVFAMFWSSAAEVGNELRRSQDFQRTAMDFKGFRDKITTVQVALAAFRTAPSEARRDALAASGEAARKALDGLNGSSQDVAAPLASGIAQLAEDLRQVLTTQAALGYSDTDGLTGAINAAVDALEQASTSNVDFSDPLAAAATEAFRKLRTSQFRFVLSHDAAEKTAFVNAADAMSRSAGASFMADDKKAEVTDAITKALKAFDPWAAALDKIRAARRSADDHIGILTASADAAVASASRSAEQAQADLAETQSSTVRWVAVTIVLIVLVCAGAGLWVGRGISRPIDRLASAMRRLAQGDLDAAVDARQGGDEIADMAAAVLTFKRAGLEKIRLEQDAEEGRRSTEQSRLLREREAADATQSQRAATEALGHGLDRLANGDLVSRLDGPFDVRFEKMRDDFNGAVGRLQQTIVTVRDNALTIRARTGEIAGAAENLARRTEQQANSIESTAASLDEVTATVRKTAASASEARSVVVAAKTDAEQSGAVVQQAITAMTEIERSSRQIGQIIGVIDEIAFQTNLLALNAGVEAARAGEAGRGFAVVASEVRGLAQRSAEAAKEIKALISTSTTQVADGVDLVSRTGGALRQILGQIGQITGIVSEIASSANEEAAKLEEVNIAMNKMDEITQQNAALVEEATAAARALSEETQDLAHLITRFQTDDRRGLRAA